MAENLETQIGPLLREKGLKIATAESFTGGLIGYRITSIPGSSDYYIGGVNAYAYEAKVALLGVSWDTLKRYGAVSREVVLEMARGARERLSADIAVSVSGIAGPGGGLPKKPVGTAWVGLAAQSGNWARLFHFPGNRQEVRDAGAEAALQMLFEYLQGKRDLDTSRT
jgi:nicotinamide-nucleotide amidase